jgi:PAS domain S-box-containing protein
MSQEKIEILKRSLAREKAARKAAEKILEDKSRDLYYLSEELKETNNKLEHLLTEKSMQLEGVFENILDAYVVMDLHGNVLKFNEAATKLFGYDVNKESLNVTKLIYKEDVEYAMTSFFKLKTKGFFKNYEARVYTKDKQVKFVHINASLILNKDKKPVAAQGIVRDITAVKSLHQQKETILKELEKRNNELHEYAHIVSHDLKSPLRSINALISWIKTDNESILDKNSLQNFSLIENTLETMEKLISDILEYSSAGASLKNNTPVNLNELVNGLINFLYIPKNIKVIILNELPVVIGDKTKFQQIFQNFISNAIKFSNKEEGLVEIDYKELDSFYQFSVKDNGIGIEKKYHEKIFKIFHSLNKSKESTGIGLSIIKKIVDLYEGDVWLESEPNKGTTFYFTIKKN